SDLIANIDATMLIVTHNLDIAATVPDNMGMLFRRNLVTFGPREVLLTSQEPVVAQFLSGRREGPIGMSEEKDAATLAKEQLNSPQGHGFSPRPLVAQLEPSPGLPIRRAVLRRKLRVMGMLDSLPPAARRAVEQGMAPAQEARP
ncbi:ABC transporter ATP-binding protein, partial [Streptomyces hundungensis]